MEKLMLSNCLVRVTALPLWAHVGAAISTIVGFNWIKGQLDASYAASKHPVDFATGQTAFSGDAIKGYYTHMLELGTLDIYRSTQWIDFGFILAMACMGIFVCTLIARISREGSWGRRIGVLAGLFALTGAMSDAIENVWSFIMLANPTDFANWLAIPYSTFAALKFASITLAMLGLIISTALATAGRLIERHSLG